MGWKKAVLLGAAVAVVFAAVASAQGKDKAPKIEKLGKKSAFFGEKLTVADSAGSDFLQLPENCEQQPSDDFVCRGPVGNASAGFLAAPGGFVFDISGSDFDDNVVVWTDSKTQRFHFAVEAVDSSGEWGMMAGAVDAGDIADEAQDRGLLPGDFEGFRVRAGGGDDQISLAGRGAYGILPGHAVRRTQVRNPFYGELVMIDGGTGTNTLDLPPDCMDVGGMFLCFDPSGGRPNYGFVDVPGGFAFQLTGTDFGEEFVLWTNSITGELCFAIDWEDSSQTRQLRVGSVDAGDIADEAQDRGLLPGDFDGFLVKPLGGDDVIRTDGRKLSAKAR